MRPQIMTFHQHVLKTYGIKGPVLEIGSRKIEDQANDFRPSFYTEFYVGTDITRGPGVDIIMNGEHISFRNNIFRCVICCEVLEHVRNPFKILKEVHRILQPSGYFIFSTPFFAELHDYPNDYWRFTPSCYRDILLTRFENIVIETSTSEYREFDWLYNLWQYICRRNNRIHNDKYYQARPITVMGYCQKPCG